MSGLGADLDQPGVLELEVRLEDGRDADAALLREPAYRRQPVAGAQGAAVNRLAQLVGKMLVQKPAGGGHHETKCTRPPRDRP